MNMDELTDHIKQQRETEAGKEHPDEFAVGENMVRRCYASLYPGYLDASWQEVLSC